jgi:hypothetical protein
MPTKRILYGGWRRTPRRLHGPRADALSVSGTNLDLEPTSISRHPRQPPPNYRKKGARMLRLSSFALFAALAAMSLHTETAAPIAETSSSDVSYTTVATLLASDKAWRAGDTSSLPSMVDRGISTRDRRSAPIFSKGCLMISVHSVHLSTWSREREFVVSSVAGVCPALPAARAVLQAYLVASEGRSC